MWGTLVHESRTVMLVTLGRMTRVMAADTKPPVFSKFYALPTAIPCTNPQFPPILSPSILE